MSSKQTTKKTPKASAPRKKKADANTVSGASVAPAAVVNTVSEGLVATATLSKRATAAKDSKKREMDLIRHINGETLSEEEYRFFSCPKDSFMDLRTKAAPYGKASPLGGLKNHTDIQFKDISVEFKHSFKETELEELEWMPWTGTVQFIQGQTSSKKAKEFMGEYGSVMWLAWYTEELLPFIEAEVPEAIGMTLENYLKVSSVLTAPEKTKHSNTPAGRFITALRADEKKAKRLRLRWTAFEERWMPTHLLDHAALENRLRNVIEEKDVWIVINKQGGHWIEGFRVLGLKYVTCSEKAEGGRVFKYLIVLQKKSGGDTREIPITFKLHWKNGGCQNLNFMVE